MLRITVSNERQRRQITHTDGLLELGRGPQKELTRFIIEDRFVSRDQMQIELKPNGKLHLNNTGGPTTLSDGTTIPRGAVRDLDLPVRLTVGYTMIEITGDTPQQEMSGGGDLQTISRPLQSMAQPAHESITSLGKAPSPEKLAEWFETLLTVQTAAAGSGEFYKETARAVVNLVGLDRGLVLLYKDREWQIAASHGLSESTGYDYSRYVLSQVMENQRTFFQGFDEEAWQQSLVGVESVVASPIFDVDRNVIGVVYGTRNLKSSTARRGIQPLEAQVIQVLAGAVSAGLARLEKEAEAARSRVRFEQFCSPELARALEANPALLDGHEREVTCLVCDLRGYSHISEQLGTDKSYDLLGDAMDAFTDRIIEYKGIVVDYAGDGILAMWNAPEDQPNHVEMACRAGQAMLTELPRLNDKWASVLGFPLRMGVGINTGPAQVGNAGSRNRMKYGPRGHTVNLTARVEGATKLFGVPILITGATRRSLKLDMPTRRICNVRVVGIEEAVSLHELCEADPDATWAARRDTYELALSSFESGKWQEARRLLEQLKTDPCHCDDTPSQLLSDKTDKCLAANPETFDPVFDMKTK